MTNRRRFGANRGSWVLTPWHATQRAAWGALKKKPESESRQEEREWKKSRTTMAES
jgi:hypothetical protein